MDMKTDEQRYKRAHKKITEQTGITGILSVAKINSWMADGIITTGFSPIKFPVIGVIRI
jgi:hypothetical protein